MYDMPHPHSSAVSFIQAVKLQEVLANINTLQVHKPI